MGDGIVITDGPGTWSNGGPGWNDAGADVNWSNATPDNAIFGGGTLGGAGTVTLGSAITAGSLTFNTPNGGGAYTIDRVGNGLTLNTGITANEDATITGTTSSLILGANNAWSVSDTKTLTVASNISGSGFGFTKSGLGTVTLSGANTFTGVVQLDAGVLRVEAGGTTTLGTGAATLTLNGGRLELASDANRNFGRNTTMNGGVTLVVDRLTSAATGTTHTLGTLTTTTDLTLNTLRGGNIIDAANSQTNFGATVLGGDLTITQGTRSFVQFAAVSESAVGSSLTVGDGVTGNGGNSAVILNGAGSWTGGTVVNSGTLRANVANSLGASGFMTTVNGGAVDLRNTDSAANRDITFANTGTLVLVNNTDDTLFNIGNLIQTAGTLTITSQRAGAALTDTTHILNEALTLNGNLVLNVVNSTSPQVMTLRFQGVISDGAGTNDLTKTGSGVLSLEAASGHDGLTDIDLGTIRLGLANALPSGAGKGDLTFSPDVAADVATLDLNGFNQTINGLATSGNNLGSSIIDNTGAGPVTLTIGDNDGSGTFTGLIQNTGGNVSLTKVGTGTIMVGGASSYSGATTVNGGVLLVNSAALANTADIIVGATADATLGFADGAGNLTTLASGVNVTLGSATTSGGLLFQLGADTASSDRILLQGGGTLTVNAGGGLISVVDLGTLAAGSYDLITGSNAVVGFGNLGLGILPGGFTYSLSNTGGGNETVTLTAMAAAAGDLYWTGNSTSGPNTSWSTLVSGDSNWSTDVAGTTEAVFTPSTLNTVNFSASTSGNYTTTLDNNYSVAGINILSGGGAVSIDSGALGTLTVGDGGINVQTSAPATTTISAPLVLGGTLAQTWSVADSGSLLDVSGAVGGGILANSTQATPAANTSLTITGSGAVALTNAGNTFTGDIAVDGGTLRIANLGGWGGPTVASTTSKTITLTNGGTLNVTSGTINPGNTGTTSYKLVQIGSGGGTLDIAAGATLTLDDAGQLFGTGNFTKSGDGLLFLSSTQTGYTGTNVTVDGGELRLQNTQALGMAGSQAAITLGAGTTLTTRINASGSDFFSDITITGDASLVADRTSAGAGVTHVLGNANIGASTLTVQAGANVNSGTMISQVDGLSLSGPAVFNVLPGAGAATQFLVQGDVTETSPGQSLTKNGTGLMVLNPTASSTFTGGIVVNAGTLRGVGQTPVAGAPTVDPFGANTITLNGGTLQVRDNADGTTTGVTMQYDNPVVVTASAAINVERDSGTGTSHITRFGRVTLDNNAILTTSGVNGYDVTFNSTGGNINTLLSDATVNVTTDVTTLSNAGATNSATNVSLTDDTGSFGLTKTGGGTLILGRTTIDGILRANGGTLQLNSTGNVLPGGIVVDSGTLLVNAANGVLGAGTSPDVQVNGGTVQLRNATSAQDVGLDYLGNATLSLQNNASTTFQVESLDIANAATNFTLNANRSSGSGTGFTSTFQGPITTNGNLQFNATGANSYATAINATSTIALGGNIDFNVGDFANLSTSPADLTIAAPITDAAASFSLTKSGLGTLALSGANLYDGGTTVTAGTLAVNNTTGSGTGSGAVTVQTGATLAGTGSIDGLVLFESDAIHSPGNSAGIQTFVGGTTYSTGSTFTWELFSNTNSAGDRGLPPLGYDGVDVTGGTLTIQSGVESDLVFNGGSVLWSDSFWDIDRSWLVFSNLGTPTLGSPTNIFDTVTVGLDSMSSPLLASRGSFSWSQSSNNLLLNYTAVAIPEPSSLSLFAIAGAVMAAMRRRRQRRVSAGSPASDAV